MRKFAKFENIKNLQKKLNFNLKIYKQRKKIIKEMSFSRKL